jgi:hypothetical protein
LCEERIIVLESRNARAALALAKRRGIAAQYRYNNGDGNPVFFEFVGILDLLELGAECDKDEVWYNIVQRVKPMERKSQILPPEQKLNAVLWERRFNAGM